jgi:hypothetical protein
MLAAKMLKPLMDAARLLPPMLDKRLSGGPWPRDRAVGLGRVAARCIEVIASERCVVAEVLPEIEAVAGRAAVVLAGRGEQYDRETGQLVQTEKKKKTKTKTFFGARKPTTTAAAAGHGGGGAGKLNSDKMS